MLLNQTRSALGRFVRTALARNMCSATVSQSYAAFETISVDQPRPFVFHVQMNRPDKLNAMDPRMWQEIDAAFAELSEDPDCRAIVFSGGRAKIFTAGLDLISAMGLAQALGEQSDVARRAKILARKIREYQNTVSALERCSKPVVAAVHSACIGAGVDLITASDIRYCTKDAWFTVKEVDIGMAADVGTLQRLPKVIGNQSLVRELCLTGRKLSAEEAVRCGLVSEAFDSREQMIEHAIGVAETIASKSPVATQAIKKNLIYSLDHTTQEGLDQIYEMNQLLLQSEDFASACIASATKGDVPVFSKL